MELQISKIKKDVELIIKPYKILNYIFCALSAIGSAAYLTEVIEAVKPILYGPYRSSDESYQFILYISCAFFYFCLCSLINLLIGVYAQSLTANKLKILELKQNQDK